MIFFTFRNIRYGLLNSLRQPKNASTSRVKLN